MKKLVLAAALVASGTLGLQEITLGHGGTYRGPGDTVPPGGGGAGGGGGTPGSGGPSTPGPSGPSTPGPSTPAGPGAGPGGGGGPTSPGGGGDAGADLTVWQFWWGFNKEPYLNLKAAIHSGDALTGSDDFFLGHGEREQARDSLRPSEEVIRGKVVPALVRALETENSNDIVSGCLIALAKIGDAKTESGESKMGELIKKRLNDSNQEIAETAAVSLGILANEENIDLLTFLLHDQPDKLRSAGVQTTSSAAIRTRAFAAFGLGLIGHRASDEGKQRVVDGLLAMLDGRNFAADDVPVACITSLGLTPLPNVGPDGAAPEPVDISKGATKPAEVKSRQDQVLWLLGYYEDTHNNNFRRRAHVPIALGRLLSDVGNDSWLRQAVAKKLLAGLDKHSKEPKEVQQSCTLALGMIGDCDEDDLDVAIRKSLMEVKDNVVDQQTRYFALIALAQAGGRPGGGQGDPVAGIKSRKDNVRSYLMEQLAKGQTGLRPWAGLALAVLERSLDDAKQSSGVASLDAKEALKKSLEDSRTPQEVGAYSIALGIVSYTGAKDALLEKLDRMSEPEARGYVAVGLGLLGERSAIEKINEIVTKSKYQPDLLKSAAIGLGLLGDKEVVDELIAMLDQAAGLSSQAAISSALGFIGDTRSIDPLIAMLGDKQKTALARGLAAAALGIVADKEELPWNSKVSVNINYRANTTTLTEPDSGNGILDIL